MTATAIAFGVTDLALEKARDAEVRVHRRSVSFIGRVFSGLAAWLVRRNARELADMAVWFKGAKAQLREERDEGKLHAPDELIEALESAESSIARGREKMLTILRKQEAMHGRSEFVEAVRSYVAAAADFQESLANFRWAAMEADADADLAEGKVQAFASLDDLLADLKS